MPTTASSTATPSHNYQKYQQLFRPIDGSHKAVASKLTDSSKFKVTVKSDTDILAVVFLFVCFVLFIFFLSYFLSIVFFLFFFFFLILFIDLRTCNSIYILTRAQHSQASEIRVCNKRGSATMSIPKMSIPKMSIPKMSIPIMSTVPKCLFPLCLLCQNVYSQNVYSFGKNELMMKN